MAKNNNLAPQNDVDHNEILSANSIVGDPVMPFSDITDVIESLQDNASKSIAFRAVANSALYGAISTYGLVLVASAKKPVDELEIRRLEKRATEQAGLYNYFRTEAHTLASDSYEEAMDFKAMFDLVVRNAPIKQLGELDSYNAELLAQMGLTVEVAMQIDADADAKALALFQTKAETLEGAKDSVARFIENTGACTPDLPVTQVYKIFQKIEKKLCDEPARIYKYRAFIQDWMSRSLAVTADMPVVRKALQKVYNDYKGDSRVNLG